jgi:hypothetical protein
VLGEQGEKVHRIIICILPLFLAAKVFATAQAPDYLIYQGEKYRLHVNPLEELFLKKEKLRPNTEIITSGNWRGYIATFEIKEGTLFISEITISKPDPTKQHSYVSESVLQKTFPKQADRKMSWFSGLLVVPLGKRTGYVHLSYASQYGGYLLIRVNNGQVQESCEMTFEEYMEYKTRQFEVFKNTPEYDTLYKKLSKENKSIEGFDLDGFLFQMGEFSHKINIPFISPKKSSNKATANGTGS